MRTVRLLSCAAVVFALFAQEAARDATALYYVVFLRPDPARKPLAKEDSDRLMAAHMANIHRMADEGLLAAAGPFENDPPAISGVFIMKARTVDDARTIAGEDPTVREHRNTIDAHAWRGPGGLGDEYFRLHKAHPETPEDMGVQPLFILARGPADKDAAQRVIALAQHQKYVEGMHREGRLAAAGPVDPGSEMVWMVVFHRIPVDEARAYMNADPAVQAGVLSAEAHRWWCSGHVLPW